MEEPKSSPSPIRGVVSNHENGVLKLPPGFRFHPTDEELVLQYLRRKAFSCPLPASIIPDIHLRNLNPWDLPGGCEQERYFFAPREAKYPNGSRSNRATVCGYWKATGKDKAIVATMCGQVVGMKKVLVFYRGKAPNGERTDWIMHEYRLATASGSRSCAFPQRKNSTHSIVVVPPKDWTLCRIFKKKRATNMEAETEERQATGFIDFMGRQSNDRRPSSPSSASGSSCVTEATEESSNGEEITSANA